jgi:FtsZ-interacting cell division protein ZipA
MPAWGWVLIAVGVVVVVALLVAAVVTSRRRARSERLHGRFGSEYDRAVGTHDDKRAAEAELEQRLERREQLDIKPLPTAARERYQSRWQAVQAEFVDAPVAAVASADELIKSVMRERGYPVDDFEQRAADVSVDHPAVVENYRSAHDVAGRASRNEATTEDLRKAMQNYRSLFDELVEPTSDAQLTRDTDAADGVDDPARESPEAPARR